MAMRRREFIAGLGAAAWAGGALGEQPERNRRIAALTPATSDASRLRIEVFLQALEQLGWGVGRNRQFDARWPASVDELRRQAAELAAAAPDVILASTNQALAYLLQATHVVPIVFVIAIDPVGDGNVASLSRPGGNATGFLLYEYSIWHKMGGITASACSRGNASRGASRPCNNGWNWPVRSYSGGGAPIQGGVDPGRCAGWC